jgi:hypothetical protein
VSGGVRLHAGVFLAERARLWVEAPAARRLAGLSTATIQPQTVQEGAAMPRHHHHSRCGGRR